MEFRNGFMRKNAHFSEVMAKSLIQYQGSLDRWEGSFREFIDIE